MSNTTKRKSVAFITLALVSLFNPNINTVDFIPDFIGCFILASAIGNLNELVPYMQETKSSLIKLGFVSLAKLPAMGIMFGNLSTGSDIVPLFTLVFVTLETYFFIKIIMNGFSALYYVGERTDCSSTISKFKMLKRDISPDFVKNLSYVFFVTRGVLNVLPEFCLLTVTSDTQMYYMRKIYPILQSTSVAIVAVFGIIWLSFAIGYYKSIKNQGNFLDSVLIMVGNEKLERLKFEKTVKQKLSTLTALSAFSLLGFDIVFSSLNHGVNLLPRFILGLCFIFVSHRLIENKKTRLATYISGGAFIVFSIINHIFNIQFHDNFTDKDLLELQSAKQAYLPIEIFSFLECLCFVTLSAFMIVGFVKFTKDNTGILESDKKFSKVDFDYSKKLKIQSAILFALPMLISILKFANVINEGNIKLIYTDPNDITRPIIYASSLPWFPTLIFAICLGYVFYSFYFISSLKTDIRMKYSDEKEDFE